jgi:hypothetical protein
MLSSVKSGPSGLQRVILSDRLDSDPLIARERKRLLSRTSKLLERKA